MEAKVTWKNKLAFTGSADSGFSIDLDSDPALGSDGNGFRPLELMAISLAGCTGMDVISILRKKQQEVTSFEVRVHADRASEYPKVFTHVKVDYIVSGHRVNPAAVERAIELSVTKYCPAQAMLSKAVEIEHNYQIIDEKKGAD